VRCARYKVVARGDVLLQLCRPLTAAPLELETFSLQQILLFVSDVVFNVAQNCVFVAFVETAAELSWGAHPERIRFDNRLLRNQRAGGNDRTGADHRAIQDDGAHADEAARFHLASVEDDVVADRDVVADVNAVLLFHSVEDAAVLNIGVVTDANFVDVTTEHGVHPDAGMLAKNNVADKLG
jgi:hypothetical protein